MKLYAKNLSTFLLSLFLLGLISCEKDETSTPSSSSDSRDVYVGIWKCQEESQQNGSSAFDMQIHKSSASSSQIILQNFYNYGFSVYAELNASGDGFTITSQVVQGNNIQGSGTLLGASTINMNYIVNNGTTTDVVTATLAKQ